MRYERKFRIEMEDFAQVAQRVRTHPASFRTLFPDRVVNNLYLDTPQLEFLEENLSGVGIRSKYRIRWYGPDFSHVQKPLLEIKRKDEALGEKLFGILPEFDLHTVAIRPYIQKHIRSSLEIKKDLKAVSDATDKPEFIFPEVSLEPVLFNRYLRSYYISFDGKFRLTLDRKMEFTSAQSPSLRRLDWTEDDAVVMEIKYELADSPFWDTIGQHFEYRLGKNSKYVNGVALCGIL